MFFKKNQKGVGMNQVLSIVMPVFNEEKTLRIASERILEQESVCELIVVDDASTDHSWEIMQQLEKTIPRIKIVRHGVNQGKGAALQTGFRVACGEIVGIHDADLEYDPKEYPIMLAPFAKGVADVVYGSRFSGGGPHRVLYYWHYVGNRFLTALSNMATNINLTDMETCFKFFRKEVLDQVVIQEKRFGVEPEITAKISKLNLRIYEVPISYYGRTFEEGKKINWKDGLVALLCIIKYNLFHK